MDGLMEPKIILLDDGAGAHNTRHAETMARLQREGAFKDQRIVVLIPAFDQVPTRCMLAWWSLIFPPNNGSVKMCAMGMEVGAAYSSTIESILAHPQISTFPFLLTLEHDNCPPCDGVVRLLERMESHPELAAISGLYYTKGWGGVPQIWGDATKPNDFRPQLPRDGDLVPCNGIGMGFALWRLDMFKDSRLRQPWFKTVASEAEGVGTQDLWFWNDAHKYGYRCAVDCSVRVGHYDRKGDFGMGPDFMW
jgi:hypothetical protein